MSLPCGRCGLVPVRTDGLCMACYGYRHRTGQDRPVEAIRRVLTREEAITPVVTVEVETEGQRLRPDEAYRDRARRLHSAS